MIDNLLSIKAATIERCGSRVREEYARAPNTFAADRPAQPAAILNSLRAGKAMPNAGQHLIHCKRLGAWQSARKILMNVPTLPRGHASRPLPRLYAKRPCRLRHLHRWSAVLTKPKQKSNDHKMGDELKNKLMIYLSFLKIR